VFTFASFLCDAASNMSVLIAALALLGVGRDSAQLCTGNIVARLLRRGAAARFLLLGRDRRIGIACGQMTGGFKTQAVRNQI
jgi:hypothetical protein